jgi:chemotaxis protein methyltransferase CheR
VSLPVAPAGGDVTHVLSDPSFGRLKAAIIDATGMAFYQDKSGDLAHIVKARMGEVAIADCGAYLDRIQSDSAEMDALVAELTIGETYFFRHKEQFDALRELILPDVIARNQDTRRLRIWSAGCATGPEPYSVSIMLEREFGHRIQDWHVSILGTDINQKFLTRARDGRYDHWAFRTTPPDVLERCFTKIGNQWQINPSYKRHVTFQYHNLIGGRFPSIVENIAGFDIIICRNVIIYFSAETIEGLIPQFRESLNTEGWLVMGHAEPNQVLFREFRTVNRPGAVLYQRTENLPPAPLPPPSVPAPISLPIKTSLAVTPPLPVRPRRPAPAPLPPSSPPPKPSAATVPAQGIATIRDLADRGEWERAAQACQAQLAVTPLDPWAHFYRAMIHEQVGEGEACEQALRRAIYLDRKLVLPHYHLGLFLLRKDDAQGAVKAFRNVLALLADLPDDQPVCDTDAVTAGHVREAVTVHLKLVGGPSA